MEGGVDPGAQAGAAASLPAVECTWCGDPQEHRGIGNADVNIS